MVPATYAPFVAVGWAPTAESYPFQAVLFDAGLEEELVLMALCLN